MYAHTHTGRDDRVVQIHIVELNFDATTFQLLFERVGIVERVDSQCYEFPFVLCHFVIALGDCISGRDLLGSVFFKYFLSGSANTLFAYFAYVFIACLICL